MPVRVERNERPPKIHFGRRLQDRKPSLRPIGMHRIHALFIVYRKDQFTPATDGFSSGLDSVLRPQTQLEAGIEYEQSECRRCLDRCFPEQIGLKTNTLFWTIDIENDEIRIGHAIAP